MFHWLLISSLVLSGQVLRGPLTDSWLAQDRQTLVQTAPSLTGPRTGQDQDAIKKTKKVGPVSTPDIPPMPTRIVVVVSRQNPIESLTTAELARIFLRKKNRWPCGWSVTVFERPTRDVIRQRFSTDVLGKKPEALVEYWMNLQLTKGLKPPKVLRSGTLVKRYLERVKGGIGYLYEHELDETVKAIEIVRKDKKRP